MIAIGWNVDIELHAHVPRGEFLCRDIAAVEICAHESVIPASRAAQTGKLVLAHQDFGEPIRVHLGLPLIIGDFVELAECLAKWLADFRRENTFTPALNFRRIGGEWMPEPD